jgi:hypothetical protein
MFKEAGVMKYIVSEGASFIANGRIYKPGDEIDSLFFKFEKTLQTAISAGKLKPIQDTSGETDTGGDTDTSGDTGGGLKPKKRKAMEKIVIDNGLKNPEEIKNLSDEDLAELFKAAGVEV